MKKIIYILVCLMLFIFPANANYILNNPCLINNIPSNITYCNTTTGIFLNPSYDNSSLNLTTKYLEHQNNMTNIINSNTSNITLQKLTNAVKQEAEAIQFTLQLEKSIYLLLRKMILAW